MLFPATTDAPVGPHNNNRTHLIAKIDRHEASPIGAYTVDNILDDRPCTSPISYTLTAKVDLNVRLNEMTKVLVALWNKIEHTETKESSLSVPNHGSWSRVLLTMIDFSSPRENVGFTQVRFGGMVVAVLHLSERVVLDVVFVRFLSMLDGLILQGCVRRVRNQNG